MYASFIRTVVPIIAGFVITMALRFLGVHLDEATVTGIVQALAAGAYYTVFRLAETHLSSGWGWFLGLARPPEYPSEEA